MSTTLDLPVIDPRIALAASTDVDGSLPEETLPSSGDSAAPSDSRWVRPAVLLLLLATGFLYFWDLSASGYANSFYAAAVQAGTKSWKAFFFRVH